MEKTMVYVIHYKDNPSKRKTLSCYMLKNNKTGDHLGNNSDT